MIALVVPISCIVLTLFWMFVSILSRLGSLRQEIADTLTLSFLTGATTSIVTMYLMGGATQ